VYAPDVAWCTDEFLEARRNETPLETAPAICVEIASPSNAIHDLRAKARAYIDAGATEAWIVFPRSRRIEFYGKAGVIDRTQYELDLSHVFD
jgi:Uma2 family endonuclease